MEYTVTKGDGESCEIKIKLKTQLISTKSHIHKTLISKHLCTYGMFGST